MHSSFRFSKVILSKAGTVASFGLGLTAGDRFVNSQSGQRLELLEESRLRHVHMRPLSTELHELGVELGLTVPSAQQDLDGDIDVDSSSLFGYSRSCFSNAVLSSAATATQLSPLVESKHSLSTPVSTSSSASASDDSSCDSASTATDESLEVQRRDHGSQRRLPPSAAPRLVGAKELPVVPLDVEVRHVAVDVAPRQQYVINKQKEGETSHLLKEEHREQEDQEKHCSEEVAAGAAAVLWSSLVEADKCTICLDLLAVPVSTSCDHAFCGFCFLEMQRDMFPFDCPNCRAPLQQGEQHRDVRRDGHIAQQVDCYKQQQEWL
mmetsp:Transcript_33252/g.61999  ORF Transcript_33252/g.61999 Transcript_33252/m.61999 type:complete len:322 (+) Transcript_33252:144-1109(+)